MRPPHSRPLIAPRSKNWIALALAFVVLISIAADRAHAVTKDWVGPGLFWNTATNWDPNGVPTSADDVDIANTTNQTILLSNNAVADSLLIDNGNDLIAQGLELRIDDSVTVRDAGTRLVLGSGLLTGRQVSLFDGAEFQITGGVVEAATFFLFPNNSVVRGRGTIRMSGLPNLANTFIANDSTIIAENGTLTFEATGSGIFDLDGIPDNSPFLTMFDISDASSALVFDGPIVEPYDGTALIGENSRFEVTHDWLLGEEGEIHFDGGGGTATVTGGAFTNQGSLVVNSGTALIDTASLTLPAISLITVEAGAELSIATGPVLQQGTIQLNGGTLSGAAVVNEGDLSGFGTIASAGLDNKANLTANGGTLVIDTASTPDFDGTDDTGIVSAIDGSIHVMNLAGASQVLLQTNLGIGDGQEFRMDEGGLLIRSGAAINFTGGSYVAPVLNVVGDVNVNVATATSVVEAEATFFPGSTTTLNANLELRGETTVHNGATFTGSADLIIAQTAALRTNGDVTFDLEVQNNGTVAPGSSPGLITINADYLQSATAVLEIELGGTALAEFDRLSISGLAVLDGTLSVALINNFVPQIGDTFEILSALIVIDEFADALFGPLPTGIGIDVQYNTGSVVLEVVGTGLLGDFDEDGDVDGVDFLKWQRGDLSNPPSASDLDDWETNYGMTAPLTASSTAAVPEPTALATFVIFVLLAVSFWGPFTTGRDTKCARHIRAH